jgi:hypothetical protein
MPRLTCTRKLARGEVDQLTIREAPKRVRMRPNVAGTEEKFTGNHDRSSRCQLATRRHGKSERRAVVQPQVPSDRSRRDLVTG